MGRFSAFAPFGLLRFSGADSQAKLIYNELVAGVTDPRRGYSPLDLSVGTHQEAKYYAWSIVLGKAALTVERAYAQGDPMRAVEGLPDLEEQFEIVPDPAATIPQRQANLTAARQATGGASFHNVVAAMRALLGSNFVAYVPKTGTAAHPSTPSTSIRINCQRVDTIIPKHFVLQSPIAPVNAATARWVRFTDLDANNPSVPLQAGDVVMVQSENSVVREKVTVQAAIANTGPFTGTVSARGGGVVLTGNGTRFTSELSPGQPFYLVDDAGNGTWYFVSGIRSDVGLSITTAFGNNATNRPLLRGPFNDAVGQRRIYAKFANAHDIGASLETRNFPWLRSQVRTNLFVVKAAVAADPETRRRIHELARKLLRGVSTWAIVRDDCNTVPFTLGTSPLGAAPFATVAYTPSS